MIIKSHKKIPDGIVSAEITNKHLKALHIQNVAPVMAEAYMERQDAIGKGRKLLGDGMERIACIPDIVFAEHPEFYRDMKALRRWLKSDDGSAYRTSTRQI